MIEKPSPQMELIDDPDHKIIEAEGAALKQAFEEMERDGWWIAAAEYVTNSKLRLECWRRPKVS